MVNKNVAILTVNYNNNSRTIKFCESLKKSSLKNYLIYVVDNGSTKENYNSLIRLLQKNKKIRVIRLESNLGWGLGCNYGLNEIRKNQYEYIFIANNDSELSKETLRECFKTLEKNKKIGICGVKILNKNGQVQTTGGIVKTLSKITGVLFENKSRLNEDKEVILNENEFVDDCALMLRDDKKNIFWYPDSIFMYYEELYLNEHVRESGYKVAYNPKAEIKHEGYGSSEGTISPTQAFYLARNPILFIRDFFKRFFPIFLPVYLIFITPIKIVNYYKNGNANMIKYSVMGVFSGLIYVFLKKRVYLIRTENDYKLKNFEEDVRNYRIQLGR